jgi:hypothetical protein
MKRLFPKKPKKLLFKTTKNLIGCFVLLDDTIKKRFGRVCSKCNKELYYTSTAELLIANEQDGNCISCGRTGLVYTDEVKRILNLTKRPISDSSRMGRYDRTGSNHPYYKSKCKKTGMSYEEFRNTIDAFFKYKSKVHNLTKKQPLSELDNYEKRGRAGRVGAYHLDHIISIKYGFDNNIDPEIIAHICNLKFITWEENYSKRTKSGMTVDTLINKILEYEE